MLAGETDAKLRAIRKVISVKRTSRMMPHNPKSPSVASSHSINTVFGFSFPNPVIIIACRNPSRNVAETEVTGKALIPVCRISPVHCCSSDCRMQSEASENGPAS